MHIPPVLSFSKKTGPEQKSRKIGYAQEKATVFIKIKMHDFIAPVCSGHARRLIITEARRILNFNYHT